MLLERSYKELQKMRDGSERKLARHAEVCLHALDEIRQETVTENFALLGIYDQGEAVTVPGSAQKCFMDCTRELAFIRSTKTEGRKMSMGMTAYSETEADFIALPLNDTDAWRICHWNRWLEGWEDTTPLQWALSSPHIRNKAVYDLLFDLFPETDLKSLFWDCKTKEAAEWLMDPVHPADKDYDGLNIPMEEAMKGFAPKEVYDAVYGGKKGETA